MPRGGRRLGRYAEVAEVRDAPAIIDDYNIRTCDCCGDQFDIYRSGVWANCDTYACRDCSKLAFKWLLEMAKRSTLNRGNNGS